jgi:hypothetical protein
MLLAESKEYESVQGVDQVPLHYFEAAEST